MNIASLVSVSFSFLFLIISFYCIPVYSDDDKFPLPLCFWPCVILYYECLFWYLYTGSAVFSAMKIWNGVLVSCKNIQAPGNTSAPDTFNNYKLHVDVF